MHVHILEELEPENLAMLQAALLPGIELTQGKDMPAPARFQVLVTGRPQREHLLASPAIHTLIIPYTGLPPATHRLLGEFPHLAVYNLHHNADSTAEMALALLLAAARFIVPFDRALRQLDWTPRYQPDPSLLLHGKTALILGFGQIGQRVGRVCHALGMRVLAIRRRPGDDKTVDFPVQIFGLDSLHDLLQQTQALIVTLPGTPETEGLVGEAELRQMPAGGVLVNVGRAPVVEQGALYRALKDRHLRAAGLDVWYHYPASEAERSHTAPADYPFEELDNIVLSPHHGGDNSEIEALRMQALAELLNAILRGESLPGQVDIRAGY
jgi:phosphoglycerate dehydrogenase-like enzyme